METLFKNKQQILSIIKKADDYTETQELILLFQKLKAKRKEFYITLDELDLILRWKLRDQYNRQKSIRLKNTNDIVVAITKTAFSINHTDKEFETALKLKLLSTLVGVEIPVASAILTICYPELYSVIDVRNWRQVFPKEPQKNYYSTKEYWEYLNIIRDMAKKFELTPQQIDLAIWQKDQDKEENKN